MSKKIETFLREILREAQKHHDGHFTLLAFTTGFKCAFGTPDLDSGKGREQVDNLPKYGQLSEALGMLLLVPQSFS